MPVVQYEVLRELSFNVFNATGIPAGDARILADHLATSNLVGHDSHGVWFLPRYVGGLKQRYIRWEDREVLRENASFILIDGRSANGIVAVTRALDLAVEKARAATFGMVGLRNVTHIGRLGDFPPRIAQHGLIGMVWMNGGGLFLAPYGSADRRLRPEPIAFAVPRRNGPPFMLDMTLSVVAGGKIEQKLVRNQPIPEGWLIDHDGKSVTDGSRYRNPDDVGVLPLGGLQFGHKGHGLAMMIEMIVGPLCLAGCTKTNGVGGGGIMILAIDIEDFTDLETYTNEVEGLVEWVGSARPLPGFKKVYAPGEIEEEVRQRRLRDGIDIPEPTWAEISAVAAELGVPMPAV
ncbi:MAG: Ldh family oxidoreductase [Candidatus Latescibacteria bacterium]|nr:Ldh family oxidoreductase [Candidatus Latescibacterota bacterium]